MNIGLRDVAIGLGITAAAAGLAGNAWAAVDSGKGSSGNPRSGGAAVLGLAGAAFGVVGVGAGAFTAAAGARQLVPRGGSAVEVAAFGVVAAAGAAVGYGCYKAASSLFD